jgi:hypothetical protein
MDEGEFLMPASVLVVISENLSTVRRGVPPKYTTYFSIPQSMYRPESQKVWTAALQSAFFIGERY